MMNIFVFMSEHFEFQTKFEFEFNWNVKEHETIMIRHMFSKKINLTPGVIVVTLHRGVTHSVDGQCSNSCFIPDAYVNFSSCDIPSSA